MPKNLNPHTNNPKNIDGGNHSAKNLPNQAAHTGDIGVRVNPQQKKASEAPLAPLLIVAGAGTGKTTTLTERLVYLIKAGGVEPRRICALTFTNKAAQEMLLRVIKKTGDLPAGRGPYIGTFHSLGAKILRKEGHFLGRTREFAIFDNHDSFELIKKVLKNIDGYKPATDKTEKKSKQKPALVYQKISEAKNTDKKLDIKTAREKEDFLAIRVSAGYEKKLEENNAFDFDDLIEKVVHIFKKYPEVLQKYQRSFDAVLVDEYQDLNPKQYELIKLLAGSHKNLSVVGDDEQLIYGWRYADLEIFQGFESDWPNAQIAFLEENYRSTGNIIAAAAAVSKNNRRRRPKNLWTKNPDGEKIKITEVGDENEEGELIVAHIENLKSKNENVSIAVLYRTNAQSRAIEQALLRRQIPYRIFGGLKFYERKEIKDIVAGLRYAANDKDEISRERLEKTFSKKTFAAALSAVLIKNASPAELIEKFIEATDYLGYLERNYSNFAERQENISELIHFASRFENLSDLLQDISLIQATDNRNTTSGAASVRHAEEVNLMTIHLAKGLEFDAVFIAGVSEGLLPHSRSIDDEERLEEERRLVYVAMTRAKKELYISFYDVPSRFLGEIPAELAEFFALGGGRGTSWEDRETYVTLD